MAYIPKGPFVDVPDPKAPPAGAKLLKADYFNGVEEYLAEGLPSELSATYASKAETLTQAASDDRYAFKGAGGGSLEPDPDYPGYYRIIEGGALTEDPAAPGYYLIGA